MRDSSHLQWMGKGTFNEESCMARALRITYPGAFYHVTSRGNERKAVFKSERGREKFLEYLESATQRYDVRIHAYCMMDTHYHLLLETPSGNLPQIMRHSKREGSSVLTELIYERRTKTPMAFL